MLTTKITYALADWIKDWKKEYGINPSIDDCIKFTKWKVGKNDLTESDENLIETILLYNID